ncbi:MAG: hypothetical protein V1859_06815 [archaeon]
MDKHKKESGFFGTIKDLLGLVSQTMSTIIYQPIAEMVLQNIENRIIKIEKRIIRKVSSLAVILLGAIFLVLALFSFLVDFFGWSKALAYFTIGIALLLFGLVLKTREF